MSVVPGLHAELLLAAFAAPARAAPAWTRWQSASGWEQHLDFESYLLLPRVYHNLGGRGVDDALFQRLKGVVRRNWAANAATLAALSRVAGSLESAGIATVLLPPCSLLLHDRSVALEAGTPIACQIARRDAQSAFRLLCNAGWRSGARHVPHWSLPGFIAASSCVRLRDGDGRLLDLRWFDAAEPGATGSAVHEVHGQALHGQVLHSPGICASVRLLLSDAGTDSELCRVSRALLLLTKEQDADAWRCLLGLLRQRGSPLLDLVAELAPRDALAGIPTGDRNEQSRAPVAMVADKPQSSTFLRRLEQPWRYYRSALGAEFSAVHALRNLPGYLMGKWQLQHTGQILPRAYRALRYHWRQR